MPVKSTVEISQNFVAFSESMIFTKGQIISEANFLILNFSKNKRKTSALVARAKNFKNCVRFMEELRMKKIASEIN